MLRRSLVLILACLLLGLALTAAYALLRLRGPAEMIEDAHVQLQTDPAGVIRKLDRCEASVRDDQELRRQLWRLRYEANKRLNNDQQALADIEQLLADGDPDPALQ